MRVPAVSPFYEGGSTLAPTGVSEKGRRLARATHVVRMYAPHIHHVHIGAEEHVEPGQAMSSLELLTLIALEFGSSRAS